MDRIPLLLEWLPIYGPWLLFTMAALETCFVTGLLVPSGLATSVATVLAMDGELDLAAVVLAALAGGFLGDSIGFWVGRTAGSHIDEGTGRVARQFQRHHRRLGSFFGRHPIFSVTVGRLVALVRTLMPMAAGATGQSYGRYLLYEIPGLLGWAAIYVGTGFLAGESWQIAVKTIGVSGSALFAVVALALWTAAKRRRADHGGGNE